ncbi:hypothetical protein BT96DRAFT_572595 [Gymnopus androsaceus JB14]|uniref:Uncharacterized protein n=1 Tax=Gymnopus androsaceus JB14 TaxID=1447944 RepID=A0A6A4GK47_9AGAR|nr:hypothetical protein BT96DRAFT_572595 [Gymnopus androsaceus JB14]
MSYPTPGHILSQAGLVQRPAYHHSGAADIGIAPTQLHHQSSYSSTSGHYAGNSSSSSSRDAHHHHSSATVQRQMSMSTIRSTGSSYAPASPIPVSSFSNLNPYLTMSTPAFPAPLSERRSSQDNAIPQSYYGRHTTSKDSSSYVYPEYLNLPPEYRKHSQNLGQLPDYMNLPPERHNSHAAQNHGQFPDYLNLPTEYRAKQSHPSQYGPIRSPGHTTHAQNPYPQISAGTSSSQRPRTESNAAPARRRRGDSKFSHHIEDPYPIIKDGRGPAYYLRVPQSIFFDEADMNRGMSHLKPITFRMKNCSEFGVRLSDCNVDHLRLPELDDQDAVLFGNDEVYREIRVKIAWPGYYDHPFTKRVNIRKGSMTRISMLFNVVAVIEEFIKKIHHDPECICDRGMEFWKLTGRERLTIDDFILTGLIHRGGPNWQPEIWCPVPSSSSFPRYSA